MNSQIVVTPVNPLKSRLGLAMAIVFGSVGWLASLPSLAVDAGSTQVKGSGQASVHLNTNQPVNNQLARSQWDLSEAEWSRYQSLMQGLRGSLSPSTLSPLEVLGIHAETEPERRAYAAKLAKLMQEDTERVLAFAKVYAEEAHKLNPPVVIDKAGLGLPEPDSSRRPLATDRFLLFVRIKDCHSCEQELKDLLSATRKSKSQVDIYIVDAPNDQAIRDWAKTQTLDPERIKRKTITLNHNRGQLAKVLGLTATVPQTVLIREGRQQVVQPKEWLNG